MFGTKHRTHSMAPRLQQSNVAERNLRPTIGALCAPPHTHFHQFGAYTNQHNVGSLRSVRAVYVHVNVCLCWRVKNRPITSLVVVWVRGCCGMSQNAIAAVDCLKRLFWNGNITLNSFSVVEERTRAFCLQNEWVLVWLWLNGFE